MGFLDPEPANQQYVTLHDEPQCNSLPRFLKLMHHRSSQSTRSFFDTFIYTFVYD